MHRRTVATLFITLLLVLLVVPLSCGQAESEPAVLFAVGEDSEAGSIILQYNGDSWSTVHREPAPFIVGIWGSGPTDVYAVGDKGITHYEGSTWTRISSRTTRINGFWGSGPNDVFIVGDDGKIVHYYGNTWSEMASGTRTRLWRVWVSGSRDVFTVGWGATVIHYNGNSWSIMNVTGNDPKMTGLEPTFVSFWGIWGSAHNNVFAVARLGKIYHYDGNTWEAMRSNINETLHSVWGSNPIISIDLKCHYNSKLTTSSCRNILIALPEY